MLDNQARAAAPFCIDPQRVSTLSISSRIPSAQTVQELSAALSGEASCVGVSFNRILIPEWGEKAFCNGMAGNPQAIYSVPMKEGRFFTAEELGGTNSQNCVVSPDLQVSMGAKLGDIITVENIPYTIIGFGGLFAADQRIWLPLRSHQTHMPNNHVLQWTLDIAAEQPPTQQQAQIYFKKAGISAGVYGLSPGARLVEMLQDDVFTRTAFSVAIFAGCFMLGNVLLILMGRMRIKTYFYSIERALGAQYVLVALQFFFENLFLGLFAGLGVFAAQPALLRAMQLSHIWPYNPVVFMVIIIFSVACCAIGAVALAVYQANTSLSKLLSQEGGERMSFFYKRYFASCGEIVLFTPCLP